MMGQKQVQGRESQSPSVLSRLFSSWWSNPHPLPDEREAQQEILEQRAQFMAWPSLFDEAGVPTELLFLISPSIADIFRKSEPDSEGVSLPIDSTLKSGSPPKKLYFVNSEAGALKNKTLRLRSGFDKVLSAMQAFMKSETGSCLPRDLNAVIILAFADIAIKGFDKTVMGQLDPTVGRLSGNIQLCDVEYNRFANAMEMYAGLVFEAKGLSPAMSSIAKLLFHLFNLKMLSTKTTVEAHKKFLQKSSVPVEYWAEIPMDLLSAYNQILTILNGSELNVEDKDELNTLLRILFQPKSFKSEYDGLTEAYTDAADVSAEHIPLSDLSSGSQNGICETDLSDKLSGFFWDMSRSLSDVAEVLKQPLPSFRVG